MLGTLTARRRSSNLMMTDSSHAIAVLLEIETGASGDA
jgi:hypothetical protein